MVEPIRSLSSPFPIAAIGPSRPIVSARPQVVDTVEVEIEPQPIATEESEKPSDYRWVVDAAGITGAIIGGALGGPVGIILGGAIASALAVPLRRYLAERANPNALDNEMSLGGEMAVTGGASLLFGIFFMGAAGLARAMGTRVARFVATRAASAASSRFFAGKVAQKVTQTLGRSWRSFKNLYVHNGHKVLRTGAGGAAVYDLVHDKKGELQWNPQNWSLDTGWGFAAAIYSGNWVYSKVFGANIFGLDTAAPMSIGTYQLLRVMAGAKPTEFGDFNYNEAIRFRYINEFANILQSAATYGRAYWRPDLRTSIAAERGLTASKNTGVQHITPFGRFVAEPLHFLYRHLVPNVFKTVIRPTVHFPVGPLTTRFGSKISERLMILKGFKGNDMMKPDFGDMGRVLSLAQVWGLVVPYQLFAAPLLGMKAGEWGAHRFWKFTAWPLIGNPIKAGLGGDTAFATGIGFIAGIIMDASITLFYNPRYAKKQWAWDLHESLAAYQKATLQEDRNKIADHVLDMFCSQMTDWDLKSFVAGEGLNKFNPVYLKTFPGEVSADEQKILVEVYENRLRALKAGNLTTYETRGVQELRKILYPAA